MNFVEEFFKGSTICRTEGVEKAIQFLSQPNNVAKMIAATEFNLPAITGIVKDLEDLFGDNQDFPLNLDAPNKNAPNRRNIGWIIRFIMAQYGYEPISEENGLQSRIPPSHIYGNYKNNNDKNSYYVYPKYFQTGAKYRPVANKAHLKIESNSVTI